jgi:hypothetical protein
MTGCAAIAALPIDLPSGGGGGGGGGQTSVLTRTDVQLTQRNYRVVQTNLRGASRGFALLGILLLKPPDAPEAFAKLLAGVENLEGHAVAVINVLQDNSAPFFLLFSLPTITFRADVVEFVEP